MQQIQFFLLSPDYFENISINPVRSFLVSSFLLPLLLFHLYNYPLYCCTTFFLFSFLVFDYIYIIYYYVPPVNPTFRTSNVPIYKRGCDISSHSAKYFKNIIDIVSNTIPRGTVFFFIVKKNPVSPYLLWSSICNNIDMRKMNACKML